jgi:hypothetical protein
MGVLSDSARKAYKVGARRAHVPDWFLPGSYLFGGLVGLFLVYGIFFNDLPAPSNRGDASGTEVLVIGSDGITSSENGTSTPADAGVTTVPVEAVAPVGGEQVALIDGGSANVPSGANLAAQRVVFALLTGNFADVLIYPGKSAPILLTTWDEPLIVGVVSFEAYGDGSLRFVLRVDPDATSAEPARDVPVLIAPVADGWAYLPG